MGTGAETPAVSSHRRAGATRNVTEINSRRVKSDRQDRTARPNGNDESATAERQDLDGRVGTRVEPGPPRQTGRADFPHPAFPSRSPECYRGARIRQSSSRPNSVVR